VEVVERFKPTSVLEIGSNDGILLRPLKEQGVKQLIGVEPASNIADKSRDIEDRVNDTVAIYATFFTDAFANILEHKFGQVDMVCANNVFAHVAGLDDVIRGVKRILKGDGVFIFENAYLLDTIKGLYFDQVYHEHLQYYGIKPLANYLAIYGMEIFDIKKVNTQGGSFRIFAQKEGGKNPITQTVRKMIREEEEYQLYENETYDKFLQKLSGLNWNLKNIIEKAQYEGKTISCYGCPAKFALFSKYFELDDKIIKYVVDDSPLKQGRFSPGKKIPIVGREHFINNPTDYCIVSVWNMAEAVIKRNPQYTGKFIVPMPEVKIV
jgi:SAM-dependent methyltransferase